MPVSNSEREPNQMLNECKKENKSDLIKNKTKIHNTMKINVYLKIKCNDNTGQKYSYASPHEGQHSTVINSSTIQP